MGLNKVGMILHGSFNLVAAALGSRTDVLNCAISEVIN